MKGKLLLLLLATMMLYVPCAFANPLDNWHWRITMGGVSVETVPDTNWKIAGRGN